MSSDQCICVRKLLRTKGKKNKSIKTDIKTIKMIEFADKDIKVP